MAQQRKKDTQDTANKDTKAKVQHRLDMATLFKGAMQYKGKSKGKGPPQWQSTTMNKGKGKGTCYKCGQQGHYARGLQSGSLQRHRHGWRHRPVQPTTVILPTTMDRTRTVALRGTMVPRSPTVAIWPATASGIQPGTTATTDAYSTSACSFHSRVWNNYNCLSHNHRPQHLQDSRAHDRQWRSSTCLSTNLWYRLSTDASYRGTNTTTSLSYRWASLGSWLQMGALQEHTRTTLGDAILRHRWHTTPHRQCYKTPGTRFRTQPQRYRVYTTERRCVSGTTYK